MQNITSLIIHRGRSVQANFSVEGDFLKRLTAVRWLRAAAAQCAAVLAVLGSFASIGNGWREVVNSRRGIFATCRVICSPFGIGFFDPLSLFD